jgi:3',5'-nucleoside bisphosphate phosphatase
MHLTNLIDLHTHSTFSDGTCSPEKLMKLAKRAGVSTIALTDHDTTRGIEEGARYAEQNDIRFIRGVELEIEMEHGEFHLLGLGLAKNLGEFESMLSSVRNYRNERNLEMIEKMNMAGIKISIEEVEEIAKGDIVARPHFAKVLIKRKIVKNTEEAFGKYLEKGKPFYSPKKTLTLDRAIELIGASGGKPIIAHPFSLLLPWNLMTDFILDAKRSGVAGIEAYHPKIDFSSCRKLEAFAKEHGLLVTGGSDFHGENGSGSGLGRVSATHPIPFELADPFIS